MGNSTYVTMATQDGNLGTKRALGTNYCCFMGVAEGGGYSAKIHVNPSELIAEFVGGPTVKAAARFLEKAKCPVLFIRLPSTTAGSNSAVTRTGAVGTSVVTITGTPYDSYDASLVIVTGGTRGTKGVVFKVTLDGGRSYGPNIGLGTATTYVIPDTGLTVNFGAGTLVVGESYSWISTEPRWATADLFSTPPAPNRGFTALRFSQILVRSVHLVGYIATAAELDLVRAQADALFSTYKRAVRVFCSGRLPYRDVTTVEPANVVVSQGTGTVTFTCATATWDTWGYHVGMLLTTTGADESGNNLTGARITDVTTTALTAEGTGAIDADDDGITFAASEPDPTYVTNMRAEFDTENAPRLAVGAGSVYDVAQSTPQPLRSPAWAACERHFRDPLEQHLGYVEAGKLDGWSICNAAGESVLHDESKCASLTDGRFLALTTRDGYAGCFFDNAPLMHAPGSDYSRLHLGAVMDIACNATNVVLTAKLNGKLKLKAAGTIREVDALKLEQAVDQELKAQLITAPNDRASASWCTISRTDALSTPGTPVTVKVYVQPLGYSEIFDVTMAFSQTAAAEV